MSLLSDVWTAVIRKTDNPVFERELRGWSYVGLWRRLRKGCVPLMALVIALPALCCIATMGLALLPDFTVKLMPVLAIAGVAGMMMGNEMILGLAGLLATALTATTISAEIETQTFSLLRMTPLSPREIVLGKFGAAMRQLRPAVLTVIGGRVILPPLLILLIVLAIVVNAPPAGPAAGPATPVGPIAPGVNTPGQLFPLIAFVTSSAAAAVSALVAFLLWLAWYFTQPIMAVMLFGSVGLLGSALSKTRTSGLFAAAGLRVALWIGSYILSNILSVAFQLFVVPLAALASISTVLTRIIETSPGVIIFGVAVTGIVSLAVSIALQMGVVLLLIGAAIKRTENLPFNR